MGLSAEGRGSLDDLVDVYIYRPVSGTDSNHGFDIQILASLNAAVCHILEPSTEPGPSSILSHRVAQHTYRFIKPERQELRLLRQSPPFVEFEKAHGVEIILLPHSTKPRPLKLAVFDMDSTLIDQEVIDEIARSIGKADYVAEITERAMRGELDFAESLKARVKMLHGVRADIWKTLEGRLSLAPGAKELCSALKANGVKMAVFSGGFQPMADWLKDQLDLDVAVANHLVSCPPTESIPYDHLTGELNPGYTIVGAERKRELLVELAMKYTVPLNEVLCVGDGANDLPMLNAVGAGGGVAVACRAKPKVQSQAPNRLNTGSLSDLLYLFGLHARKEV